MNEIEKELGKELGIDVKDKLNAETAKMEWHELERFFAKGVVIRVDSSLDLIIVAAAIVEDDKDAVAAWMADDLVGPPGDKEVTAWVEYAPLFWAVVVAPWVIVQEIKAA